MSAIDEGIQDPGGGAVVMDAGAIQRRLGMRKLTGSEDLSYDTGLLNDTDYGMALGAGLAVDAGRGSWILQGRYDAGFADLGSNTGAGAVHSSAWVILTGDRV